ncbi:ABC-2 family transporter protein [Candidatus Gottesmanbacteria bacterium]|nr:ABC-2 family transporter protein [Candidatus Gottesmanbacteria bacterium]
MKKYVMVVSNSLQEYFAYRLNFILWRVRVIVSILISFFLWQTIFKTKSQVFGYQQSQMLTYILLITFLNGIVLSTQTFRVAEEINLGTLSNFLIRPFSYFGYVMSRDISDKIVNTFFSIFEIIFLIIILHPPIFVQTSVYWLGLFFVTFILAALLFFEIGMMLSIIGFWSRDTWAPRFIFFILVTFLAGTYFPLDILPKPIYSFLQFLPFTYLIFFPLKIYLGQMDSFFLLRGLGIMISWIILMSVILRYSWRRGLKIYTAEGI